MIAGLLTWLMLSAGSGAATDPSAVVGTWWTQDRDGVVQVTRCATGLCGRVTGVTTFRPDGSAPVDYRGRSRCQLQIIPDGKVDGDGVWDGHITNPDDGKTYTITMRVDEAGKLRMRGYIGIPLFGRTTVWSRFQGHLTPDCHIAG